MEQGNAASSDSQQIFKIKPHDEEVKDAISDSGGSIGQQDERLDTPTSLSDLTFVSVTVKKIQYQD